MSKPKKQKPTAQEIALGNRQILDAAKLDEQENDRIKNIFSGSRGQGKLFRAVRASGSATANSYGATGGAGAGASSSGAGGAVRPGARVRSLIS